MYALWGRRLKRLNRTLKLLVVGEEENKDTDFYCDLTDLRECAVPALKLHNPLTQQEFVRFTDEERLFEMMEIAVKKFNFLLIEYFVPNV